MNSSTSALFQNRIQYSSPLSTMNSVKTANPIIFPSLHPMSNFYKQKQDIQFAKNADSQTTYKKVKCENGSQQVRTTFNAPIISKPIVKEPVKQAVNDIFRVPNLPKRLNSPTNPQLTKIDTVKAPENFGATSEPLVIPDNIKIEWKAPQMNKQQALPQRNKANNVSQPQINFQLLNQVYENLKMEFYAFQLKQNLAKVQQLRQQEMLGQALKQILVAKPSEGKEFAKRRKRSSSIDTDTDSIKEENVKQEIAL